MGKKWSQQTRAKVRATRKNNKIKKNYPLLVWAGEADEWLTTPDKELKRLEEFNARQEEREEQRYTNNTRKLKGSKILRSVCLKLCQFNEIEKKDDLISNWGWSYDSPKDADTIFSVWFSMLKNYYNPPKFLKLNSKELSEFLSRTSRKNF